MARSSGGGHHVPDRGRGLQQPRRHELGGKLILSFETARANVLLAFCASFLRVEKVACERRARYRFVTLEVGK